MSIYNKTWDVDEEITSDSLNQMAADIGNTTDDIHPQYALSGVHRKGSVCGFVSGNLYHDGGGATTAYYATSGDASNISGGTQRDTTDIFALTGGLVFSFKKLHLAATLNITYTDYRNFAAGLETCVAKSYYRILSDGSVLASGNYTTVEDTHTARTLAIDISGVTDGLSIVVELYCKIESISDGLGGGPFWLNGYVSIDAVEASVSA
jgi:hypothetical protein